jgi:hypothetical protein
VMIILKWILIVTGALTWCGIVAFIFALICLAFSKEESVRESGSIPRNILEGKK